MLHQVCNSLLVLPLVNRTNMHLPVTHVRLLRRTRAVYLGSSRVSKASIGAFQKNLFPTLRHANVSARLEDIERFGRDIMRDGLRAHLRTLAFTSFKKTVRDEFLHWEQ